MLIFENKGEVVGVSNPHPHCQIYATNFVFKTIETEARVFSGIWPRPGACSSRTSSRPSARTGGASFAENESAIAFLPYFARYAYEVFVAPKATHPSIATLSEAEVRDFADALKRLWSNSTTCGGCRSLTSCRCTRRRPTAATIGGFHFHIEFHPPLRTPNLMKYLAGPEIGGGNFLSDTSPEEKAAELRAQPEVHYKQSR